MPTTFQGTGLMALFVEINLDLQFIYTLVERALAHKKYDVKQYDGE